MPGARNQRRGIAASVILGWGALAGAMFCAAWALATHSVFTFDPSLRYIGSLLYLAVAASCGGTSLATLAAKLARYADFEQRFESRYGKVVVFAPYGYDAMMLLADAMRRPHSVDPHVYLPALETANYTGVIGTIRFNPQVSPLFEAESIKESSRA